MSNFLVVTLLLQMSYVGKMQFFFLMLKQLVHTVTTVL